MTRALKVLVLLGCVQMFVRGADYLSVFEHSWVDFGGTTALVWGWFCVVAALVAFAGLAVRHSGLLIFGCTLCFSVYFMLAVTAVPLTLIDAAPGGFRIFTDHLCHSGFWGVLGLVIAFRTGVDRKLVGRLDRGLDAVG